MRDSGVSDGGTDPGPGPGDPRGALGGGGSRGGGALGGGSASPQIARFPEMIKRALGLKSAPAWAVPPAILPTWLLNAAGRPEEDFLRGERTFSSLNRAGPVAAQFGFVRLENPNMAQLLVVTSAVAVILNGANATRCCFSTQRSVGTGSTVGADTRATDGRSGGQATSGADCRQGTRGAGLSLGVERVLPANAAGACCERELLYGWVLPGGWSLEMESQTANVQINGSFLYRVVAIDPSELTGATP